jgi:predicted Zn-dependent protease
MRLNTLIVAIALVLVPAAASAQDAGTPPADAPKAAPVRPKLSAKDQKLVAKKLEQAGEALKKKEVDKGEKLLREVLAKAPGHELAAIQLAEILGKTDRRDKALELLEGIVNGPLATERLIIFYGAMLERARRGEDAKKVLTRGAANFKSNVPMRVRLGQLHGLSGRVEAEKWYKEALALDKLNRTALNNLAVVYTADARYADAAPLLEAYARTNPNAASGRFNLASTYLAMGRPADAQAIYDKLLVSRPNDSFAIQGKAMTLVMADKPADARVFIVAKVGDKPTAPQIVYAMALALLFEGKPKDAEALLTPAIAGPRSQTWMALARAESLRQLGRASEADKLLTDHMTGSNIARPHALPYLAIVKRDLGKKQEARALLEEAFGLQRDYKRPEDLKFLVRMPPAAVGAVKTALAPDAIVTPPTTPTTPKKEGCACAVGSGEGNIMPIVFLLGLFVLKRRR